MFAACCRLGSDSTLSFRVQVDVNGQRELLKSFCSIAIAESMRTETLELVISAINKDDHSVDWGKCGAFKTLSNTAGLVTHIEHKKAGVKVALRDPSNAAANTPHRV